MAEPVKSPVKAPVRTPATDPERYVRKVCPQQTRKWAAPWIIFPTPGS